MTTLKIQFTRPAKGIKVLSWVIRKVLHTEYSHVLARWFGAKGKIEVVWEAAGSSIRFLGPIAHKNKYIIVKEYSIVLDKNEYLKLIEYTHEFAHVNYGKMQLIGMLFARVFSLKYNPISQGKSEQVCSEAIAGLLSYVKGWHIDINLDVYGPDAFEKWLINKLEVMDDND